MTYDPILERQNKALADQRRERLERESKEAEADAERKRQNDAARSRYLASLEAERAERRAATEAKLEAEIGPERERAMRDWLANHVDNSEKDFLTKAWPHLRKNVLAERERQQYEREVAAVRATGKYSF
ncbi:MAG: hypothetical protein M3R15_16095 [Acidobacteriota bacterium]|nr:hypothetical protein [Acidobacteriota bacterium]